MKSSALLAMCVPCTVVAAFEIPFKLPFGLSLGSLKPQQSPELFALHKDLIEIPSVTGSEHDVGVFLERYLSERNYTVERILVAEGSERANMYAYIGEDRNPRYHPSFPQTLCIPGFHFIGTALVDVLLAIFCCLVGEIDGRTIVSSHIDVVPPHIPYSISGNTIYGRGSNDAKGSVATQIQAVEELRKAGKISDGDVAMLFVVGEEVTHSSLPPISLKRYRSLRLRLVFSSVPC